MMDELALRGLGQYAADPVAQARAVQYFTQLKASEDGWKLCAAAFTSQTYNGNDSVKFFCLQVVEDYIKHRYAASSSSEQENMHSFLMACYHAQNNISVPQDKSFIRNKLSQLFSLAFVVDYPERWPSFFTDLLLSARCAATVDMYLRILQAIDTEVVDREIVQLTEISVRSTNIKDHMREQAVQQIVDSWLQIITTYETSSPEIACLCLDVIGRYISWIDIGFIANDRFVVVLLKFMTSPLLRESTCDCIHEIIYKGMDPAAKTKLVESFATVLENAGILNPSEDEEGDYLAKVAKLVNGMGMQLIAGWMKLVKTSDTTNTMLTQQAIENKVVLLLRFLGDEDDDVSAAVSGFAGDYIMLLKQSCPLSHTQRRHMEQLLYVVIKKMKYDTSYNFEQRGEDEAMFQEYRKQLKVIFSNLAQLDSSLILITVHNLVVQTFPQWETADYHDIEVAIYLLYILAEALPASHSQHFSGDTSKTSALQEMMRLLITSRVSCHGHTIVSLEYFETLVRYDRFFNCEPQHVPDAVMSFLDERGMRHKSAQVRSRSAYLFSRFVKSVKQHVQTFLEEILKNLEELLVLGTPDSKPQHLSSDDQLFVYETAGILVASSSASPEKKQLLMRQLLAPVLTKFNVLLDELYAETDEQRQLAYAQCVHTAMAVASRASKGFSNSQTMKQCNCIAPFTEALRMFLRALNAPVHRQLIHTGVKQFIHRMVVCLDDEILAFVPIAMENLLKQAEPRDLHDFLPLMNQLITKFKKSFLPILLESFVPLVTAIFQALSTPSDECDQVTANDKRMLQRSYYGFLGTILGQNLMELFTSLEPNNLQQVLMTVVQGGVDLPDPLAQKMCFNILKKLVETWGGKDQLRGFEDFMYKSIVPACFLAPMKPTFDLSDAQTVAALGEISACLKCILEKRGDEMMSFMQRDYLPTLNLPPTHIEEYCMAMKSDNKTFRNYLKVFFTKAKS